MQRAQLMTILALALVSCTKQIVELFPEDARVAGRDATTPDAPAPDTSVPDAEEPDAEARDAEAADAEAPDAEAPDAEEPDAGTLCVCRFSPCRLDTECARAVSATSTCDRGVCVGSLGMCRVDSDCGSGFLCTAGERSTDACP